MAKKLNVEKVDDALKRAARVAVSGNDEQRAGRLIVRDVGAARHTAKAKKPDAAKKQ